VEANRDVAEQMMHDKKLALEKAPEPLTKAWWCDTVAPDLMVGACTTAVAIACKAPFVVQVVSPFFTMRVDRFRRWAMGRPMDATTGSE
jgi:hypothetical protein